MKRAQEQIEQARKNIRLTELKINPKQKFKFTSRKLLSSALNHKPSETKTSSENAIATEENTSISIINQVQTPGTCLLFNRKTERISLRPTDFSHQPDDTNSTLSNNLLNDYHQLMTYRLQITSCDNCLISVPLLLGSARLENVSNSIILLGPCSTSVYLENCSNCHVFIICHQLRIHTTIDTCLYVRVHSHPIIEDCKGLRFSPNFTSYDKINEHIKVFVLTIYVYGLFDVITDIFILYMYYNAYLCIYVLVYIH